MNPSSDGKRFNIYLQYNFTHNIRIKFKLLRSNINYSEIKEYKVYFQRQKNGAAFYFNNKNQSNRVLGQTYSIQICSQTWKTDTTDLDTESFTHIRNMKSQEVITEGKALSLNCRSEEWNFRINDKRNIEAAVYFSSFICLEGFQWFFQEQKIEGVLHLTITSWIKDLNYNSFLIQNYLIEDDRTNNRRKGCRLVCSDDIGSNQLNKKYKKDIMYGGIDKALSRTQIRRIFFEASVLFFKYIYRYDNRQRKKESKDGNIKRRCYCDSLLTLHQDFEISGFNYKEKQNKEKKLLAGAKRRSISNHRSTKRISLKINSKSINNPYQLLLFIGSLIAADNDQNTSFHMDFKKVYHRQKAAKKRYNITINYKDEIKLNPFSQIVSLTESIIKTTNNHIPISKTLLQSLPQRKMTKAITNTLVTKQEFNSKDRSQGATNTNKGKGRNQKRSFIFTERFKIGQNYLEYSVLRVLRFHKTKKKIDISIKLATVKPHTNKEGFQISNYNNNVNKLFYINCRTRKIGKILMTIKDITGYRIHIIHLSHLYKTRGTDIEEGSTFTFQKGFKVKKSGNPVIIQEGSGHPLAAKGK